MLHLCVYSSLTTTGTGFEKISTVEDGFLNEQDGAFIFPKQLNLYTWWVRRADTAIRRFRLESSRWRDHGFPNFIPCVNRVTAAQNAVINPEIPRESNLFLPKFEPVYCFVDNSPGSAEVTTIALWIGDKQFGYSNSEVFTLRFTCTVACIANVWSSGVLIPEITLPAGRYQVVGMNATGSGVTGLLARLIFQNNTPRPGCPINIGNNILQSTYWRYGHYGIWGEFDNTQVPIVEVLSTTTGNETPTIDLDLIKVR